jgi:predicted methyltransferase
MRKFISYLTVLVLAVGFCNVQADSDQLMAALEAQPEEMQVRYEYRHPKETLEFFGIEPGMTVVEALPGGGWYSKILLSYLGQDGTLIGADYAQNLFPLFGFYSEEAIEAKKTWAETWTAEAESWRTPESASVGAFAMGSMPDNLKGTADAVVFIRALHNLKRFDGVGGFLTISLQNAFDALKPGGVFGVVQHWAPDGHSDEFGDGSHGYLKKAAVIERLEYAGFEFIGESDINANPNDQPTEEDIVWRLPPSMVTSRDNPELAEQLRAVGESNRMTLKFRKP